MGKCISCGNETDKTYVMYECRVGNVEKKESRTEYIPTEFRPQKRQHYKITTTYDTITEHPFGFCNRCLYKNRSMGLKLLAVVIPALIIPGALLVYFSGSAASGSGTAKALLYSGVAAGFAGIIGLSASIHFIFAGNWRTPYYAKKAEMGDNYGELHNCLVLDPKEFEYLEKKEFKQVISTWTDVVG